MTDRETELVSLVRHAAELLRYLNPGTEKPNKHKSTILRPSRWNVDIWISNRNYWMADAVELLSKLDLTTKSNGVSQRQELSQ